MPCKTNKEGTFFKMLLNQSIKELSAFILLRAEYKSSNGTLPIHSICSVNMCPTSERVQHFLLKVRGDYICFALDAGIGDLGLKNCSLVFISFNTCFIAPLPMILACSEAGPMFYTLPR